MFVLVMSKQRFREFLQDLDGIVELIFLEELSGVDVIQLIVDGLVKCDVANTNYLLLARNPNMINIPRTISYQIADMSARLQLLKLRNIINK